MEKINKIQHRHDEIITSGKKVPSRISTSVESYQVNRAGELQDLIGSKEQTLVNVGTDTGAFVSPDREIATENLMGCIGLFIKGTKGHGLIHLTPSSKLGYSSPGEKVGSTEVQENYLATTLEKIMPSINKLGSKEKLEVVLLANLSEENRPELERIKQALSIQGIQKTRIEILPLDGTLIAYLPQNDPDHLVATGHPLYYPEGSKYLHTKSLENQTAILPINSEKSQTLELPQKSITIPTIQNTAHDKISAISGDIEI